MRSSLFTMRFRRICVIVSQLANWRDNPFLRPSEYGFPRQLVLNRRDADGRCPLVPGRRADHKSLGRKKGSGIFYKIVKIFLDNPLTHTEVLLYDNGASEKAHSAMMHEIARQAR